MDIFWGRCGSLPDVELRSTCQEPQSLVFLCNKESKLCGHLYAYKDLAANSVTNLDFSNWKRSLVSGGFAKLC